MDFDAAARRLAKEQSQIHSRRTQSRRVEISARAKREAVHRQAQQARLVEEKREKQRQHDFITTYMRQCDRMLGLKGLGNDNGSLLLRATSIHGQGDKIALPPSVLQFLTNTGLEMADTPWTFRIAIRNTSYEFPASPLLKSMSIPRKSHTVDEEDSDSEEDTNVTSAYLDEMTYRYLAYTHATVVEFTQDEGCVGIPEPIAAALLSQRGRGDVLTTRTTDPSANTHDKTKDVSESETDMNRSTNNETDEGKTPGHIAWGAFDVPDCLIEVSLVHVPKGQACTLVPTQEALKNGFHNLKDVKLVLEQSLIRTRATLSVGDLVHSWHRGKKYDLTVRDVAPSTFNAVLCINTDIEVEFGRNERSMDSDEASVLHNELKATFSGRRLGDPIDCPTRDNVTEFDSNMQRIADELTPEPPLEQNSGVCIVQIRGDGTHARRRFDVQNSTVNDLFAFASFVVGTGSPFRLVTRFPRRVFIPDHASISLADAGIADGQELFLIERI